MQKVLLPVLLVAATAGTTWFFASGPAQDPWKATQQAAQQQLDSAEPTLFTSEPAQNFSPVPASSSNPLMTDEEQQRVAQSIEDSRTSAAHSKMRLFLKNVEEANGLVEDLRTEIELWETNVEALGGSENGKKIASDDQLVERFLVHYRDKRRPAKDRPDFYATELQTLAAPVQKNLESDLVAAAPTDSAFDAVSTIADSAHADITTYRESRIAVEGLIAEATTTADVTLNDRLLERRDRKNRELETVAIQAGEERRQERQAELIASRKALVDAEIEEEKRINRLEALSKKITPEVLAVLAPFVTPEYWHYGSKANNDKKLPYSLSHLRSLGCFKTRQEGWEVLQKIACDRNDKRPRWNVFDRERIQAAKAQEYLIELGEALVYKGHLQP